MSGQQHEKTRERAPANLGIKFNPALGATTEKKKNKQGRGQALSR